jgi:hypothetical protein
MLSSVVVSDTGNLDCESERAVELNISNGFTYLFADIWIVFLMKKSHECSMTTGLRVFQVVIKHSTDCKVSDLG